MSKLHLNNFGGLNERAGTGNPERLEFTTLQNAKREANGNLRRVKAHDFVHESTDDNRDVYVEEDGTVRELTFTEAKTHTNKAQFVKLGRRETLYNLQSDDVAELPKLLIDGGDAPDEIKNSSFPSYGIPFNSNSKIVPDNSGNFYVIESNLEIKELSEVYTGDFKTMSIYDTKISLSVKKYDSVDYKSGIATKIDEPPTDKELYLRGVTPLNFPIKVNHGDNSAYKHMNQHLNWDYCLTPDENTLYIVYSSAMLERRWNSSALTFDDLVYEFLKIVEIDISGDTILHVDTKMYRGYSESYPSSKSDTTEVDKFKSGFGIAHDGTLLWIKGVRFSVKWNTSTFAYTEVDSTISMPYNSTLLYNDSQIFMYEVLDGIYEVNSSFAKSTQTLDLTSGMSSSNFDVLLTKLGKDNVVYLWQDTDDGVYPLNLDTPTVGTIDSNINAFPLYYDSGWVLFNNYILKKSGLDGNYAINQSFINNGRTTSNGFQYQSDDRLNIDTGNAKDFKSIFVDSDPDIKKYDYVYKESNFIAIGVRFNSNLYTPPINYAIVLAGKDRSNLNFSVSDGEILSKASSSNSFASVNEVFLFGNNADVDDYYQISNKSYVSGKALSLPLITTFEGSNYSDVMGISHADGFALYYKSICGVDGRIFAVGGKTDSQSLDTLSQIIFYTDGHPSGLNPASDYILTSDIINPISVVGVQSKCLVIGENDVGFVWDRVEQVFRSHGTINANAVASNGDLAFYLHREGVMLVDQYNIRNISENVIDPEVFKSMSETEFKQCSGAIHGEYGLYILSDPTNKKIYCFDIASCYGTLRSGSNPYVFTTKFDLSSTYDTFNGVFKLQSFYNKVYGQVFINHGGSDYWMTVELFADDSGEASHSWQGSGLTQGEPFDNRNQVIIETNQLVFRPRSAEYFYKSDAVVTPETKKVYKGTETSSNNSINLPINTSLRNHKKQYLKNMKCDHFGIKLTTYGTNFELEEIIING